MGIGTGTARPERKLGGNDSPNPDPGQGVINFSEKIKQLDLAVANESRVRSRLALIFIRMAVTAFRITAFGLSTLTGHSLEINDDPPTLCCPQEILATAVRRVRLSRSTSAGHPLVVLSLVNQG